MSWGLFNHKSRLRSHSCFCFETQQGSGEGGRSPHVSRGLVSRKPGLRVHPRIPARWLRDSNAGTRPGLPRGHGACDPERLGLVPTS